MWVDYQVFVAYKFVGMIIRHISKDVTEIDQLIQSEERMVLTFLSIFFFTITIVQGLSRGVNVEGNLNSYLKKQSHTATTPK